MNPCLGASWETSAQGLRCSECHHDKDHHHPRPAGPRGAILQAFLREMGARQMWKFSLQFSRLEGYMANGRVFIVQIFCERDTDQEPNGWEIFIPACELNNTGATLNNARHYIETGRV